MDISTLKDIGPLMIGISGLGLAAHQAIITRANQRISVRPLLRFDDNLHDKTTKPPYFYITMSNEGLGTALIVSYDLYYLEKKGSDEKEKSYPVKREYLREKFGKDILGKNIRFNIPELIYDSQKTPEPFKAGREDSIEATFVEGYDCFTSDENNHLKNVISKIGVAVCYCSLYGQAWVLDYNIESFDRKQYIKKCQKDYEGLRFVKNIPTLRSNNLAVSADKD